MGTTLFKRAFLNVQKSRLNSVINVLGFSPWIATCLFIFLFVRQETFADENSLIFFNNSAGLLILLPMP
jgi:hypothetical protein